MEIRVREIWFEDLKLYINGLSFDPVIIDFEGDLEKLEILKETTIKAIENLKRKEG